MADTTNQEIIELAIRPIPPDTVASIKEEILSEIEAVLKEKGQEKLLVGEDLKPEVEKTFPIDQIVILVIKAATPIAVWAVNEIVIPKLREKYGVDRKKRSDRDESGDS